MVIKYKLEYFSDSEDYAYLASWILKDADVNVIKTDNEIIIFLQGEEGEIKDSFAALGERLPLSLYLGSQRVEKAAFMPKNYQPLKEASYMAMYPAVSKEILEEGEGGFSYMGHTFVDGVQITSKSNLTIKLKEAIEKLKEGKTISLKTPQGSMSFSLDPAKSLMVTNLKEKTADNLLLTKDETLTLGAMERPFVLKLYEEGLKTLFFPNDPLSLLLCKEAMIEGIDALYLSKKEVDTLFEYKNSSLTPPDRAFVYFCGADRFFVNREFTPVKEGKKDALFFETSVGVSFGMYAKKSKIGVKKLFSPSFFTVNIFEEMREEFEFGARLSSNFERNFADISKKINDTTLEPSSDASNFFKAVSYVLSDKEGFEALAFAANRCESKGGVKLDLTFVKKGEETVLDLKRCFTSILSYKIAGVEDDILAFSIFESFVDLIVEAISEVKKSFNPCVLEVGGEFLIAKPFVSNLKAKIKNIDIDMALNSIPDDLKNLL